MKPRIRAFLLAIGAFAIGGCGFDTASDSFAPVVEITAPLTQIVRGGVAFSANVVDDTGVSRVIFLVDGVPLAEDTVAPYVTEWATTSVPNGEHTIRVEAEDIDGNRSGTSRLVIVNNQSPN
jgi:hypothetical protein